MKKLFVPLAIAAVVAMGYMGYGAYSPQSEEEALLLENVEALTSGDVSSSELKWSNEIKCVNRDDSETYRVCEERGPGNSCTPGGSKTCDCGVNC